MNITKRNSKNHEGVQYYEIIPQAEPGTGDQQLLANWVAYHEKHEGILHTFFDEMDPIISRIMNGDRGQSWQYEPFGSEWPFTFYIREIVRKQM